MNTQKQQTAIKLMLLLLTLSVIGCATPSSSALAICPRPVQMPAPSTAQPTESYSKQLAKPLTNLQKTLNASPSMQTVTPQIR